jgi:hypothetical protein
VQEVPCPGDYDFTQKIQELLAAGHIHDQCSGSDLVVSLDSWSALWECADPDGDGQYTFGRTFYFSIADQCGNEMPDLCSVTYSGKCQPVTAFTPGDWSLGSEGSSIDLPLIQHLLDGYGPLTVGGLHRSLTLTDAQCLASLLPGKGYPGTLANCHQTNCQNGCNPTGPLGLVNTLAASAIALEMNLRYSMMYNGASFQGLQSLGLGCVALDPSLYACPGGNCYLHLYGSDGVEHQYPYTLGGLQAMLNAYLDGGIPFSDGQSGAYATALNKALESFAAQYSGAAPPVACSTGPGVQPLPGTGSKAMPVGGRVATGGGVSLGLSPNPTGGRVRLQLDGLDAAQEVSVEIYNMLGQAVYRKGLGRVGAVDEQLDLTGLGSGLYTVIVRAGTDRFERKLVIGRD